MRHRQQKPLRSLQQNGGCAPFCCDHASSSGLILSLSNNAAARNVVPCVFHAVRHVVPHVFRAGGNAFHAGSNAAPGAVPCQWSGPQHLISLVPWRTLQGRTSPPIPAEKSAFRREIPFRSDSFAHVKTSRTWVSCFPAHNSEGPRLIQVNGWWLSSGHELVRGQMRLREVIHPSTVPIAMPGARRFPEQSNQSIGSCPFASL